MSKNLFKYNLSLNIILSIIIGFTLFIIGDISDAPGICVVGIIISFLLIMHRLYFKKIINVGYTIPIILITLGSAGILFIIILSIDKELLFFSIPTISILIINILLIYIGFTKIEKLKSKK